MSPGDRLRAAREAAGLSREDLALGLETVPLPLGAKARADLIALAEIDCIELTDADVNRLEQLIATLAFAFADRAPKGLGRAAESAAA